MSKFIYLKVKSPRVINKKICMCVKILMSLFYMYNNNIDCFFNLLNKLSSLN